jgi:rubrerythrin
MRKFIRKAIEIEKLTAKTYLEFAKNEDSDADLVGIWAAMANDEEEHAMQLNFATRLPIDAAFAGIAETCPEPAAMYDFVYELYQKARQGNLSKQEMLNDAIQLETTLHGIHATHALIFKDSSLLQTFEKLADSEEKHVAGLEAYIRRHKEKNQCA